MLDEYFEIRVYWHRKNGNKELIKAIRHYDFPTDEQIARAIREYAGDSAEVVKSYEVLPFT